MGKGRKKKPAHRPTNPNPILSEVERFLEGRRETVEQAAGLPSPAGEPPAAGEASRQSQEKEEGEAEAAKSAIPPPQHPDLELFIRQGGLVAVVRAVYPGTTLEEVLGLLRRHEITSGVSAPAIRKVLDTVRRSGRAVSEFTVARGKPPLPPSPPRLEHCPPEGLEALPDLEPIRAVLAAQDQGELAAAAADLRAWAVRPGQRLALKVSAEGKPGLSVQGQPIPAPVLRSQPPPPQVQPGPGVSLGLEGSDYLASTWGYAGLLDGRVAVLCPLWVAPDAGEACLVYLPLLPGSSPPAPGDLRAALTAAGVSAGVDEVAIPPLCRQLESSAPGFHLFTLARARPSVPPQDAALDFAFTYEFRVGAVRSDGSIDFKERNFFPAVQKDTLLVECRPPVPGKPGQTVLGEEIPPGAPTRGLLVAGENTRLEEQGQRLYAQIDGGASVQILQLHTPEGPLRQCTVAVRPVAQISGDVGYETGNLDLRGNLAINGSVTSGFRVKSTGDIAISGSVEPGAQVQSGGSLTVQQGILGRETRVQASGNVVAKFVQEAHVQAGGDVLVGIYAHGAQIQAGGRVQVEGSGTGGGIVGGRTWAAKGVEVRNLGSPRSNTTQVFAGIDPERLAQLDRLRQNLVQADAILQKFLRSIGLTALEPDAVRQLVARRPAGKTAILYYVKKANQLAQVREKYRRDLEGLSTQLDQDARTATIDVPDTAHARVTLQIGNQQLVLPADLKRARFHLDPSGEQTGIFWRDLAPSTPP